MQVQKTLKKTFHVFFRKELRDAVILRYWTLETVHGARNAKQKRISHFRFFNIPYIALFPYF